MTPHGVVLCDAAGRIQWVNEGFTRMCGYELDELKGATPGSVLQTDETDPETISFMSERVRRGEGFRTEVLNRAKDGRLYWCDVDVRPTFDAGGRLEGFVALEADITETKEAARRGKRLTAALRNAGRIAQVGGWEIDYDSGLVTWSEELSAILGHPPRPPFEIGEDYGVFDEEEQSIVIEAISHSARTGARFDIEVMARRQNGETFCARLMGEPELRNGQAVAMRGALQDITQQREAMDQLRRSEEQLREANASLAAARDQAEAGNRAKSEFLANMSHELRTPMNGVVGMLDLLVQRPMDEGSREMVVVAQDSAQHMLRLLNEILDFAWLESGDAGVRLAPCDVRGLVDEVTEAARAKASATGARLEAHVAPEVPARVLADGGKIRQVLTHVTRNGLKFAPGGDVRLDVTTVPVAPGRLELVFSVTDNGPGVPAEARELIFERFRQADNSTTRRFGGAGLGLAIARELVQAMGGAIRVESAETGGARFVVNLPVETA